MSDAPLRFEGHDSAVIGVIERCGQTPMLVYDYRLLVKSLQAQGLDELEAEEWIAFNMEGGWLGEGTPGILRRGTADEVREWLDLEDWLAP